MRTLFSLYISVISCAVSQQLVERYTVEHGLSQNLILSIAEDAHGFLWFGTKDGLNRFDGYSFRSYRANLNDSSSLSSNYISSLYVDNNGTLWIGTAGGGLNRFNEETGTFSSWQHREHDSATIPSDFVVDVTGMNDGRLLVVTDGGGVSLFDASQHVFHSILRGLAEDIQFSLKSVRCILLEGDSVLWMGTRDAGLWRYEISTGTIHHYSAGTGVSGPSNNRIKSLYQDRNGILWVCTENGIEEFNPRKGMFSLHRFPDSHGNLQPGISISELPDGTFFVNVWTDQGIYDPHARVFRSTKFGVINLTYRDRSGMLWLSESGYGVMKYNPFLERFHRRNGAFAFELFKEEFTAAEKHLPFHLSSESIDLATVAKEPDGALWFFKKGYGYYRYDRRTDMLNFFPAGDSVRGIRFQFLPRTFVDRDNTVWITESTILARYNPRRQTFTYFSLPSYTKNPELLRNKTEYPPITTLFKDSLGYLWLGTSGMGLVRFNPNEKAITIYQRNENAPITLTNNFILTIHPDPSDPSILWLGTDGGGLNRFDTKTETVTHYFTTTEGLPNNVIYGILSDKRGRLWMSSNAGLFLFDPVAMKVLNHYDVNDGLQSNEFNRYQFWKDKTGKLYFGGINGWNSFYPEEITPRTYQPPIVLTDLRIFNVSVVYPRIAMPLTTSLTKTDRIVLQPDQNMITIEFASLDYAAPKKIQYKYFLEGFDDHWIDASPSSGEFFAAKSPVEIARTATYTNLDPGEYIFRVKGTNSDGVWNDSERTLTIVVLPPFWKTTWFRVISLVAVFLVIGGTVRAIEMRKIKERTRRLEQETAIERERLRISKDMHDDIGSRLTQIELLSNLTRRNMDDAGKVEKSLEEISTTADDIVTSFDEIVWAVNPRYDTVADVMDYLSQYVSSYLGRTGIESHVSLSAPPSTVYVSAETRHNIFMVLKESLNNIVKYASATEVWVQFLGSENQLTMTVRDNGVGFDVSVEKKFSEGLTNMRKRMEDVGGTCVVESTPGSGTTVTAVVPLRTSKNHPNG